MGSSREEKSTGPVSHDPHEPERRATPEEISAWEASRANLPKDEDKLAESPISEPGSAPTLSRDQKFARYRELEEKTWEECSREERQELNTLAEDIVKSSKARAQFGALRDPESIPEGTGIKAAGKEAQLRANQVEWGIYQQALDRMSQTAPAMRAENLGAVPEELDEEGKKKFAAEEKQRVQEQLNKTSQQAADVGQRYLSEIIREQEPEPEEKVSMSLRDWAQEIGGQYVDQYKPLDNFVGSKNPNVLILLGAVIGMTMSMLFKGVLGNAMKAATDKLCPDSKEALSLAVESFKDNMKYMLTGDEKHKLSSEAKMQRAQEIMSNNPAVQEEIKGVAQVQQEHGSKVRDAVAAARNDATGQANTAAGATHQENPAQVSGMAQDHKQALGDSHGVDRDNDGVADHEERHGEVKPGKPGDHTGDGEVDEEDLGRGRSNTI